VTGSRPALHSIRTTKTIAQLARLLNVDEGEVAKVAGRVLVNPSASKDRQFKLKPGDITQVLQAGGWDLSSPEPAPAEDEAPTSEDQPVDTRPDPPADPTQLHFRELAHPLRVHLEVFDALPGHPRLKKRLGVVLQHLAAHGRTSVVKGLADERNRGWWRSPLGGNQGKQFYLWWASQGARPVKDLDVPAGHLLVRAVRHHDDHSLLEAGGLDEYVPLSQPDLTEDGYVEPAWTAEQLDFVQGDDPVRFVVCRPVVVQTTVLWRAIEARRGERVLYLTWSRELLRTAREHLHAFASEDVQVVDRDFVTLLSELCGLDVPRRSLSESRATLEPVLQRLPPATLGPWAGREGALHAEVRAFLVGRAVPGQPEAVPWGPLVRLDDATYQSVRGKTGAIGSVAARALLEVAPAIEEAAGEAFPELVAACQAIERLQANELPSGLASIDRVVVDEAQDLTLLELSVVAELCRAIARTRGTSPWLLLAGDEGQTVRPSGFDWGPVSDLVATRVGTPRKYPLDENLRCPARIAAVIDRASETYVRLTKGRRPTKQRPSLGGQHVDAQLLHVVAERQEDAAVLLERLVDLDDVVVLSPGDELPAWIPEELGELVLTPAQAKGLEYQSVCLLDPGRVLQGLKERLDDPRSRELEEHACRTVIDQLRVALSRATETLAFVDVEPSPDERKASEGLLAGPAPFDPEDLPDHFEEGTISPEERILRRTDEARRLIGERPARAWRRALQAVRLLGDPELPNGVADPEVRFQAERTLLATAARLLVDGIPAGFTSTAVPEAIATTPLEFIGDEEFDAFDMLEVWTADRTRPPLDLLDATLGLGEEGDWLRDALTPVAQELRQALDHYATDPNHAHVYVNQVDGWLDLTGSLEDLDEEARRLRCLAAGNLLEAGRVDAAEAILALVVPPEPTLVARLHEARGQYVEAAEVFETLEQRDDALRNWRAVPDWERALQIAPPRSAITQDLRWLRALERVTDQRPEGILDRLTGPERERFEQLLRDTSKPKKSS